MIFATEEEMRKTLERLVFDFPNIVLNPTSTPDCPWQIAINLGAIDKPTFLGWAIVTKNLSFCSYLVMDMLEDPQPDWMKSVISQFGSRLLE